MDPQMGRTAFRLGMLVTAPSLAMLLFLRPGTAEFSIAVLSVVVGLAFLGAVAVVARRGQGSSPRLERRR